MNKIYISIFFGIALVFLAGGILAGIQPPQNDPKVDAFAKCLGEEKGATMYGAVWCSHCQNEKKRFGTSFKFINYVECSKNVKLCSDRGIVSYPTWIFSDGKRLEGELGFEKLSEASGCKL